MFLIVCGPNIQETPSAAARRFPTRKCSDNEPVAKRSRVGSGQPYWYQFPVGLKRGYID